MRCCSSSAPRGERCIPRWIRCHWRRHSGRLHDSPRTLQRQAIHYMERAGGHSDCRGEYLIPCPLHIKLLGCRQPDGHHRSRASGSALFDQNIRVVGSLSLGNAAGATDDGYLQCPLSPPPSPTAQNALALFTSLAAVWDSTSDPTGSASTIQQVLDPNHTATLVVN